MKKLKKFKPRKIVQLFFFLLILLISINHSLSESGKGIPLLSEASLHGLCPFGGVVSIYQFFAIGTLVKKIHSSSIILMGLIFLLTLLFGPVFCGWICPLGTIQEWFSKIGRKIFKVKFNKFIPYKYDKYLRYIRYLTLIWVIYITAINGILIFEAVDPYYALFNFYTGEVLITGIIVLILTLVLSLFVERPWCKYLCPYGALLGIINTFKVFKIKRNSTSCISCGKCDGVCPMNIEISNKDVITNHQCISCMECTSENICPVEDTVELATKGGN